MIDLYLITHKVRNEPAFDVAMRMPCPECATYEYVEHMAVAESNPGCTECDHLGYWYIIPTSGHRAYPCSCIPLSELDHMGHNMLSVPLPLMEGLPDHYRVGPAPRVDIRALLRANRPPSPPVPTIPRRFL